MEATWQAVAPGRVNLIGEHTDYNDLPVLPMALDRAVRVTFRARDDRAVSLVSPLAEHEPFSFSLDRPIEPAGQGDWSNYVRAAARGLLDHGVALRRGIEGSVEGDVPAAAGLSSSSALVVGAALALLHANGARLDPLVLATVLARAERYVGLAGGGMDQAVCLHGRAGVAVRIDFAPLRVAAVPIPPGWRWVVAHSLVRAEKSGSARAGYNDRARSCARALTHLGRALGVESPTYPALVDRPDALVLAEEVLDGPLFRRVRHVLTEARRVEEAEEALRTGRAPSFGELMLASHRSLRDDYEVSVPALDEMVAVAMRAGAHGARLTGAGFGGCIVALCDDASLDSVRQALARDFYAPRGVSRLADLMFEARPSEGARVLNPPAG